MSLQVAAGNTQIVPSTGVAVASTDGVLALAYLSINGIEVVHTCGDDMAAEGHEGLERYAFLRWDVFISVAIVLRGWRSGIRFDRPVLSVARSENGGRTYVEVGRDLTERQAAYIVLRHFDMLRNGDE